MNEFKASALKLSYISLLISTNISPLNSGLQNCYRLYSSIGSNSNSNNDDDKRKAKSWVEKLNISMIPEHEFDISYSRSSGPGGQKVNKSKCLYRIIT